MKKQAFTLIELMVVVAIIAILATLSVTSFSAAIKRTRNAGRQADIQAVAKALETCYDVPTGKYAGITPTSTFDSTVASLVGINCLNDTIKADMSTYPYTLSATGTAGTSAQTFIICAKLETVGDTSIGNSAASNTISSCSGTTCEYFCIRNQQ